MLYRHLLKNGLTRQPDAALTLAYAVPDEILALPPARRRQHDAHLVATWAYRARQEGAGWAELARETEETDWSWWERSERRVEEIELHLAALETGRRTEAVEDEIAYERARLAFVKERLQGSDDLPVASASSIRNAVRRGRMIWELAEGQLLS